MTAKYIQKLLESNNRVILPEFGAFLKSTSTGELMFSEYITLNDGLIAKHIAEVEGVNKDEAEASLKEYVNQLKSALDENESIILEGVGKFWKENSKTKFDGNITEEPAGEELDPTVEEEPVPPVEEEPVPVPVPIPDPVEESHDSPKEEEAPPVEEETPPVEEEPPPVKVPFPKMEIERKPEPEPDPEPIEESHDSPEEEPEEVSEPDKEDVPPPPPVVINQTEQKEEKRRRGWLWLLLLLLLLVVIVIWAYFNQDTVNGWLGKETAADKARIEAELKAKEDQRLLKIRQDSINRAKADSIRVALAELQKLEAAEEAKTDCGYVNVPKNRWHLIGGAFSYESNAEKFVTILTNAGFESKRVGCFYSLNYVSYMDFATKAEAVEEWEMMLDSGYEVWVYYY